MSYLKPPPRHAKVHGNFPRQQTSPESPDQVLVHYVADVASGYRHQPVHALFSNYSQAVKVADSGC